MRNKVPNVELPAAIVAENVYGARITLHPLKWGSEEGLLQPTGMSIDRCIEALTSLDEGLDRLLLTPGTQSVKEQQDELDELIRNLTLDIDLRSNTSTYLMTEVESDVYLPVIEKILALLVLESPNLSDSLRTRRAKAKELAGNALKQAKAHRI